MWEEGKVTRRNVIRSVEKRISEGMRRKEGREGKSGGKEEWRR